MFAQLGMPDPTADRVALERCLRLSDQSERGGAVRHGAGLVARCLPPCRSCAAVGIFVWLFAVGAARDWLLTVALALRDRRHSRQSLRSARPAGAVWPTAVPATAGQPVHAVRDFILVMIGRWPWPTFNLADSSLVCGAGAVGVPCPVQQVGRNHEERGIGNYQCQFLARISHHQTLARRASEGVPTGCPRLRVGLVWRTLRRIIPVW